MQLPRGSGKRAGLDHPDEGFHRRETVHSIPSGNEKYASRRRSAITGNEYPTTATPAREGVCYRAGGGARGLLHRHTVVRRRPAGILRGYLGIADGAARSEARRVWTGWCTARTSRWSDG